MPSLSRAVLVGGCVVLVAGVAIGGWGVFLGATDTCESGSGVTITRLDGNETVDPATEHVAYSDLSASEQRVFTEILAAERTLTYQNSTPLEGLTQRVVTYRGEQYETSPLFISDCFPVWPLYKFWGGLTALLGGVIVAATYGWRRVRS